MRTNTNIIIKIIVIIMMTITLVISNNSINLSSEKMVINDKVLANSNDEIITIKSNVLIKSIEDDLKITAQTKIKEEPPIVYDNLTMEDLINKLNRIMKSTLTGKGEVFASYALANGVDPYIALAIVFQETGCYYGNCSSIVQQCNNIGGMKGGTNRCGNGSYAYFNSIDEGVMNFINTLSIGYFSKGLTTPELMNSKYAADTTWAYKVNNYVDIIKNS